MSLVEKRLGGRDGWLVAFVSLACVVMAWAITTQVLHVRSLTVLFAPAVLFLAYHISYGWTPIPQFRAGVYWSICIVLATAIAIGIRMLL